MNYKEIAKTVNSMAKNTGYKLLRENQLLSQETKEKIAIIKGVFSKYEVSGDVFSIVDIPDGLWA